MVEYQREDDGRWFKYRSRRGHEVGNELELWIINCMSALCKCEPFFARARARLTLSSAAYSRLHQRNVLVVWMVLAVT